MDKKIAILASGNGSNAENIVRYFRDSADDISVRLIISNRPKAFVVERAKMLGMPCCVFSKEFWDDGKAVLALLLHEDIDWLVLAGFLAKVPDCILDVYRQRVLNIHPSLLPKYGGKGMYGDKVHRAVLAAGESQSGITIHYVSEAYDAGEVVAQYACPVLPGDTPDTLAARVHELEYAHYPQVIAQTILSGD